MPKVDLFNISGEVVGNIELNDGIFGVEVNEDAMHQVVLNQLANQRQGTQSTKTRGEVSGGGRKPYRQKGTGRARQGSTRATQWRKGGIALGPKPRSYRYTLPKKLKRLALQSALSSKTAENNIVVLESLELETIKTRQIVDMLKNLKVSNTALLVLPGKNETVEKSARNIPGLKTSFVNTINVFDILKHDALILTKDAVTLVEEVYI